MTPGPWKAYDSEVFGVGGEVIARCEDAAMALAVSAIPDFLEAAELAETDPANAIRLLRISLLKARGA